jgi:hypothetical protein
MAKFSSRDDTEYGKVLYALEMLLKELAEDKVAPVEQSMWNIVHFHGIARS